MYLRIRKFSFGLELEISIVLSLNNIPGVALPALLRGVIPYLRGVVPPLAPYPRGVLEGPWPGVVATGVMKGVLAVGV